MAIVTRRLCTIAARNYLPSVQLLAESCRVHHPEVPLSVLLVDAEPADEFWDLPFEVLRPADLAIDATEFGRMATYYSVTEFATALKPTLLRQLLADNDTVMYLDPDIEVFASLSELFADAEEHAIALTPHVLSPIPRDGLDIAEETIFLSGQFNLGFIALSRDATDFLRFWEERARRHAVIDHAKGYFTDQRWVDAVPSMFPHMISRDVGCNVAYWNLHERHLGVEPDGSWSVNGEPLRFFHFSGHDDAEPFALTQHLKGQHRIRVDQQPALRRMLRERCTRIADARGSGPGPPYRWGRTATGARLDTVARHTYWEAVREADRTGGPYPPHAFDGSGGRNFCGWCNDPISSSGVSRHLYAYWRMRPDLQSAFPDPLGASSAQLLRWSALDPGYIGSTPPAFQPQAFPEVEPGVNLVGYLSGEFGVASASRVMSRLIRGSGMPVANSAVQVENHRHNAQPVTTLEGAPFELSVLMLNADALIHLWDDPFLARHRERRRVGVWYWEVGILPEPMRRAYEFVDEIWCASDHIRLALEGYADRPVIKHPLVLTPTIPTSLTRPDLGLPDDRFLFGFAFDYSSVFERKNPAGLVEAYREAFGPGDGAALVLKTIHSELWPEAAAQVREAADGRDDILFIDGFLSSLEMRAFFQLLDGYVSLHRAEGLGLTIASAMAAGVPTIATGWSGNLEFMTAENSVLVPYELREVGPGALPYPPEACWAEPDREAAAAAMRAVFDDPDLAARLGDRGRSDLAPLATHGAGSEWLTERYEHVTQTRIS
jgi:glycosyltransferase involved in cell wall biosynthesis